MIGADAIIKCLEAEGVSTVFGYPGVAICPFFNSILDSDIKTVLIRTEQNAAHAASGVARMTGRPGVCAVTSGPGATNVITGIATAFADSIPMICITGQVNSELLGSDVFQEADITGAVESFVKYSYLVKNVNDIPRVFKEAFYIANTGRKGPVLIDIPIDIQNATIKNFHYPEEVNLRTYKPTVKGHAVQIKKVIKELERAKRPIICAGGGVLLSEAEEELRNARENLEIVKEGIASRFAELSNTQIRSTIDGMILDVPIKVGNSVIQANTFNDGTTIATVADMSNMQFQGNVDETDVGKLHEGMPVKLTIGALQDVELDATLEYVAPKSTESNGVILFEVKAAVQIPEGVFVRAGYSANASIVIESREGVLTLPESTVEFEGEKTYVYLLTNAEDIAEQTFDKREVKIGLSDGINIELTEGVTADDKVRGAKEDKKK